MTQSLYLEMAIDRASLSFLMLSLAIWMAVLLGFGHLSWILDTKYLWEFRSLPDENSLEFRHV